MDKANKDIVRFAVDRELDSYNFYMHAKKSARTTAAREFLDQLAKQELIHKQKLEAMKLSREELVDLSALTMDDYTISETIPQDMQYHIEYQQILLLAMKRELLSVKLYTDMRRAVKDEERQKTFDRLIREEQSHRDALQNEYDTYVLTED